jgi:tripartite-type tricarboxylate transporter receptor subunit TctC
MSQKRRGADRRPLLKATVAVWLFAAAFISPGESAAELFPAKPLRIVVPAAAGGNLDLVMRNVAMKLSEQLGQQVIVDNKPGGNYMVAVESVAKAPADGYTYLAIADSFLYTPAVARTATYDPLKDFAAVSLVARVPQILVVNPLVPANSVAELVALAKRRPGELTYGTSGNGSTGHIAAALFSSQAGIQMTHVPYKGNSPALIDVMGGRISLMFDTVSTSVTYVKSGKLKALGVTSPARSALLPDVPTVSDSGLPGYEASIFNGIVALAGTPPEILARVNAEIRKLAQQRDIRSRLLQQGVELVASDSPQHFTSYMKTLSEKYVQIVKKANIRAD